MSIKERFMKNIGYLILIVDIGIYFILSYVFVEGIQQNLFQVFINGALLFTGAMIASSAMRHQGLLNGADNQKYKETLEAHLKQKQKIYHKLNTLQPWLDYDYYKLMKIGRSVYVNSAGYDYSQVFTPKGKVLLNFKVKKPAPMTFNKKWWPPVKVLLRFFRWLFGDDWKVYRTKKRFIRKAKHYKITRLTVSDLMNIDADKDPNNFGKTEKQYERRENSSDAISRLIFSCLLPSISFGFFGFSIEAFMIQLVNMALILITALFSMFTAYSFKVKTHRNTIISKINKMEEFDNSNYVPVEESDEIEEVEEAELVQEETFEKENAESEGICSEKPIYTESNMVEKI